MKKVMLRRLFLMWATTSPVSTLFGGRDMMQTTQMRNQHRFGTETPFELLEKYLIAHPSAVSGHPGHKGALKHLKTQKYPKLSFFGKISHLEPH